MFYFLDFKLNSIQTEACIDWLGVGELLGGVHVMWGGGGGVTNAANQDKGGGTFS